MDKNSSFAHLAYAGVDVEGMLRYLLNSNNDHGSDTYLRFWKELQALANRVSHVEEQFNAAVLKLREEKIPLADFLPDTFAKSMCSMEPWTSEDADGNPLKIEAITVSGWRYGERVEAVKSAEERCYYNLWALIHK